MGKQYTREEMYELVWSEPIRTLAERVGVSDTAIRNVCKKAKVPLPHQGHWAKRRAGKRTVIAKLPPRFPGASNLVAFGRQNRWEEQRISLDEPLPPYPSFDEPLANVLTRVETMVGKVTCPLLKTRTHPAIQKLLEQDEERKKEYERIPIAYYTPRFTSSLEKRRLRIINALFLAAQKVGCRPQFSIPKYADEEPPPSIQVGAEFVAFLVEVVESGARKRAKKEHGSQRLIVRIKGQKGDSGNQLVWKDGEDTKLEKQLSEILVQLIVSGERQHRDALVRQHEWLEGRKKELELKREREEQDRLQKERERLEQVERERVERLLSGADDLLKARTIRNYVAEIRSRSNAIQADSAKIEKWAAWALAQADKLDPVMNPEFLEL